MHAEPGSADPRGRGERPDWLYGTGVTPVEKGVVWLTVVAALPLVVLVQQRSGVDWQWWHWLLVVGLAADVVGGVVANSLASAKRLYHQAPQTRPSVVERVLRNHLAFAALHVHPFLVVAVFPGAEWGWAAGWYVAALVGVALVLVVPLQLKRPAGMGIATLAVVVATTADGPGGLTWLGPVLVLKLVAAHAVPEG